MKPVPATGPHLQPHEFIPASPTLSLIFVSILTLFSCPKRPQPLHVWPANTEFYIDYFHSASLSPMLPDNWWVLSLRVCLAFYFPCLSSAPWICDRGVSTSTLNKRRSFILLLCLLPHKDSVPRGVGVTEWEWVERSVQGFNVVGRSKRQYIYKARNRTIEFIEIRF